MSEKLYLMPSGKFPMLSGKPVLITEDDYLDCCCYGIKLFNFISISWIDEADPVYSNANVANWDADVGEFNTMITRLDAAGIYHAFGCFDVCNSSAVDNGRIKPTIRSYPTEIIVPTCGRESGGGGSCLEDSATLQAQFRALFDILKSQIETAGGTVEDVMLTVDNSGSMYTSSINPAYTNFVTSIETDFPDLNIIQNTYRNERWVYNLIRYIVTP